MCIPSLDYYFPVTPTYSVLVQQLFILSLSFLCSATFDYEAQREYTDLVLIVEDNGRTSKRRSTPSSIRVMINNLNDEQTVFDQAVYSKC